MISIIVPSYNYGHLVAETIVSIQRQTYTGWEMIIVDDGSTDNTAAIVKERAAADPRIRFFQQSNAGPSAARNLALREAKGDFIQFLDADDLLEAGKFTRQLAVFAEMPEADIVYGPVRYFKEDASNEANWLYTYWGAEKEWMPKIKGKAKDILVPALKGSFAHISCFLFRKSIVDKAGPWDITKRAAEDYLFVLNCVLAGAYFEYQDLKGSYALVRWHDNNASRNVKWIREAERKMRLEITPRIMQTGSKEAVETNRNAIKALEIMNQKSWRSIFLSGGPLDFLKKGLRVFRLEKFFKNLFYKSH
jgi:glycosyltransferase involved in cell wall biosynthesis